MAFLIEHMPAHDLRTLDAEFLLEHVDYAYRAWESSPWKGRVSRELFLNGILPYYSVTEPRDRWRPILRETCLEIVAGSKSPSEAAVRLNQEIFPHYGVIYSKERSRNDQSVSQVVEEQKATCTGLSVLLTHACRSVGVPARLVGTPLWADSSGNHSWVEVWDGEWFYTGAAEPAGDRLNDVWFGDRAARAQKDVPVHAIYATSYERTGTIFPMSWDLNVHYVHGVNVTDRYAPRTTGRTGTDRKALVRFVAYDQREERVPTRIEVRDTSGARVFAGVTRSDRADMNDHLTARLQPGREYVVHVDVGNMTRTVPCRTSADGEPMTLRVDVHAAANGWGRPGSGMEESKE